MRRRRLLSSETDRNTASPTESAVWRRRGREHSGADRLNAKIIDQWISVGLYGLHTLRAWVGKDTDHECFVVLFFSMRVVPRNNKRTLFRPGIQRSILRAFFCLFQSHLDYALLHLDVASRQIDLQSKVFIHASMIHTFDWNLLGSEELA